MAKSTYAGFSWLGFILERFVSRDRLRASPDGMRVGPAIADVLPFAIGKG
jgi:hypothetical protein